jgi:hypothetical protein
VGPDPFSIWNEYSALVDNRPGNDGYIESRASPVTFERSVGPLPGDFNGDNVVDAADYVVWRKGLGTTYTQDDYNTWRTNFGRSFSFSVSGSGASANAVVPEPASITVCVVGMFMFALWRGRK